MPLLDSNVFASYFLYFPSKKALTFIGAASFLRFFFLNMAILCVICSSNFIKVFSDRLAFGSVGFMIVTGIFFFSF